MSATCRSCGYDAEDFKLLAQHITANRKTHPKWQQKWAVKFLSNATFLDQKVSRQNDARMPLSDQERENKEDCHRELSGELRAVKIVCPHCKRQDRQMLPIEYVDNPLTWRINSTLVVNCSNCRK